MNITQEQVNAKTKELQDSHFKNIEVLQEKNPTLDYTSINNTLMIRLIAIQSLHIDLLLARISKLEEKI